MFLFGKIFSNFLPKFFDVNLHCKDFSNKQKIQNSLDFYRSFQLITNNVKG